MYMYEVVFLIMLLTCQTNLPIHPNWQLSSNNLVFHCRVLGLDLRFSSFFNLTAIFPLQEPSLHVLHGLGKFPVGSLWQEGKQENPEKTQDWQESPWCPCSFCKLRDWNECKMYETGMMTTVTVRKIWIVWPLQAQKIWRHYNSLSNPEQRFYSPNVMFKCRCFSISLLPLWYQ